MSIERVENVLRRKRLTLIPINCLHPDDQLYTVLAFQPYGNLESSNTFLKNCDREGVKRKFSEFIKLAGSKAIDLAITPEYACPWEVIEDSIQNNWLPKQGKIWIFGCESITPTELDELADRHKNIKWIYERITPSMGKTFLDPACLIFNARDSNGKNHTVFIVQFKNCAMGDRRYNFERDKLLLGTRSYVLSNDENSIFLHVLICSDALNFSWKALPQHLQQPYLICHLQLNLDPQSIHIRPYRQEAYRKGWASKEFFCLNWAKGFKVSGFNQSSFGGSVLFTKASDSDLNLTDERLSNNHIKGFYYTRLEKLYAHSFVFNYGEHAFLFRTTKCSQALAAPPAQKRTGPEMLDVFVWHLHNAEWRRIESVDDGFSSACGQIGGDLSTLLDQSLTRINIERLLTLSSGKIRGGEGEDWYDPKRIIYFNVREDEIVQRLTVADDPDRIVNDERNQVLQLFSELKNNITKIACNFPITLKGLRDRCQVNYSNNRNEFNFNLYSEDRSAKGTGAFIGAKSESDARRIFNDMADLLGNDQSTLVVWYFLGGRFQYIFDNQDKITKAYSEGRKSITKEGEDE